MESIIRRARLMDGRTVDIGLAGGRIAAMEATLDAPAAEIIDAGGRLVLPAFVNGQLHACKSFWRRLLHTLPPTVQALPRFDAAAHVKRLYTADDVFARVDETMRLALRHGTCAIRLFGDVDQDSGLAAIEGLLRIRAKYAPLMTVQIVAFPQDGMADEASVALLREALIMGADVVGGIPWIEPGDARQRHHVARCFDLAQEFDKDLHFVCDDVMDPAVRSLEMVARETLARGYHGRVSATQCAALSAYPDAYAAQVIALLAEAGITVFSNSHVALIATDFAPQQPWPRGVTRVRELLDAGVPVACGQDDIDNWFYAFGRNDMLEVAQFMAHNGQFAWAGEVDRVLAMVTSVPAKVLGLRDHGLRAGTRADIVILDAENWHEAIQFQAEKSLVMLNGEVVVRNERSTEWGA